MSGPEVDVFARGVVLFDQGAFFEAHEAWEERWLVETDAGARLFFQGLIQVAAGFYKLRKANDRASAGRLLAKGLAKLEASPEARRVELGGPFLDGVRAWRDALSGGDSAKDPIRVPRLAG